MKDKFLKSKLYGIIDFADAAHAKASIAKFDNQPFPGF